MDMMSMFWNILRLPVRVERHRADMTDENREVLFIQPGWGLEDLAISN